MKFKAKFSPKHRNKEIIIDDNLTIKHGTVVTVTEAGGGQLHEAVEACGGRRLLIRASTTKKANLKCAYLSEYENGNNVVYGYWRLVDEGVQGE